MPMFGLLFPIQRFSFNHIIEARQKQGHEHQHLQETQHAQLPEVDCPRIHKDHLDIEQYKEYGSQEIFDGERVASVALCLYTALKHFEFVTCFLFGTQKMGSYNGGNHKPSCKNKLKENGQIIYWQIRFFHGRQNST
jgi:hypothetical protein